MVERHTKYHSLCHVIVAYGDESHAAQIIKNILYTQEHGGIKMSTLVFCDS